MVSELTDQLKKAGRFGKQLRSGTVITDRMIDKAGRTLAATLLHPRVEPDDILGILDEFKRSVDDSVVRIVGKKGINRAIKDLKAQMLDLDAQKARAYLVTSEAGQVADFLGKDRYFANKWERKAEGWAKHEYNRYFKDKFFDA